CMKKIFIPTINAMNAEGRTFKGCLYFGLILTSVGPKVIEYNCRFGDPETQVVLPLLKTDLFEVMQAVTEERLAQTDIEFSDKYAACVVLASGGYPVKYETGKRITGLVSGEIRFVPNTVAYHAGTQLLGREIATAGGRVLGITAVADTLQEAVDNAYKAADIVQFKGMHKRMDIGQKALAAKL
ncbi:MAG: phosphoribosylglycinamide synthetase C domain-containing protein, partial [Oscillospiraceae bacterium]